MGTTPNFAIPYPELTDPPDGSGQMKALATAVDNALSAMKLQIPDVRVGVISGNMNSATNVIIPVTFVPAYAAGKIPAVVVAGSNTNSTAGNKLQYRAKDITNTAFNATITTTDNAANTALIGGQWIASLQPSSPLVVAAQIAAELKPAVLTCRTADCPGDGYAVPYYAPDDRSTWQPICGACGQLITDVS